MSNSYLISAVKKFEELNPYNRIVKVELSKNDEESKVTIWYEDNGKTLQHCETFKPTQLTDDEIIDIKKRARKFKWWDDEQIKLIPDIENPNMIYIIYSDGWFSDIYVIDRFKGKSIRLVESKLEMEFKDLAIFLIVTKGLPRFYHDEIGYTKRKNRNKDLDIYERLFLIHSSVRYNGVLPLDWHDDYEKAKSKNYLKLWNEDKFLPGISIKDPKMFDSLIFSNAAHSADSERYLIEQKHQAEFFRLCYNNIREKYRLKGLKFNHESKNTHYIYSILKYYSVLNNNDWFMIRIEKLSTIRSIPHSKIRQILDDLVRLNVLEIDITTKPMSYKVIG